MGGLRSSISLAILLRCALLGASIGAISWASPSVAHAYEEQATLSLSLGYAAAPLADHGAHKHGFVGALGGSYGLNQNFSLEARLAESVFLGRGSAPTISLSIASVGFNYAIDITDIVPLFGAGVGGAIGASGGEVRGDLVVYGTLGFDYLLSRTALVGFSARVEALPFRNIGAVDALVVTAEARIARVFDLF